MLILGIKELKPGFHRIIQIILITSTVAKSLVRSSQSTYFFGNQPIYTLLSGLSIIALCFVLKIFFFAWTNPFQLIQAFEASCSSTQIIKTGTITKDVFKTFVKGKQTLVRSLSKRLRVHSSAALWLYFLLLFWPVVEHNEPGFSRCL